MKYLDHRLHPEITAGQWKEFFQTEKTSKRKKKKKKRRIKERKTNQKKKKSLQQLLLHGKIKAQQNSITFQNSWMDVTQVWALSVEVSRQKGLLLNWLGYYFSQGTELHPKTRILEKKSHVGEWGYWPGIV